MRPARLTERLFGRIMAARSNETAPVRDLRGGSRRAARTHRRPRTGSQHDLRARYTGSAAVGLKRLGAHQKEHHTSCCPVPPHRPSLDVAPPCVAFAGAPLPPRPATAHTAAPMAARASSRSTTRAALPSARSAGTSAGSRDPRRHEGARPLPLLASSLRRHSVVTPPPLSRRRTLARVEPVPRPGPARVDAGGPWAPRC